MRNHITIRKFKHTIGLCIGVLAALVILTSETCYYSYMASYSLATSGKDTTIDIKHDNKDDSNDHAILSISKDAVSSVAHMNITQALHFITEIYSGSSEDVVEIPENIPDFNTYFKTLFRLIISPNAP
ncbi:hypothetical protein [Fulvivirga ligni]|uniref:hypothetical protein n=1 Tax=Fulvivirga ligni TaxID=2904246 RepID=UPI001F169490|nr:hypothetical protein [Fulvivirga ligni]UII22837.1 hypothetical protein LVD16_06330 [Fulvivirga ligni]